MISIVLSGIDLNLDLKHRFKVTRDATSEVDPIGWTGIGGS
jgi:hypothetical protein